ncbi:uncharacterized protein LOC127745440 isoform X2 [Arachis duranensis]|uniref:Uncharacterized protein LOC127745440 isoform X2 n=1 Tax=Arachis duranensis TaxID=130453 RepID=A0A9C6WG26_ARADU|nr:uncharacterized protein LOC127745440 isoform X2 [Arachis duranensis]
MRSLPLLSLIIVAVAPSPELQLKAASTLALIHSPDGGFQNGGREEAIHVVKEQTLHHLSRLLKDFKVEVEPATLVLLGQQCKKFFWPLLSLHNEIGMDPLVIRVRAVPGLVAADNFALWSVLIQNLAKIGYEGKNVYMASYDWKLSFENTQVQLLFQE